LEKRIVELGAPAILLELVICCMTPELLVKAAVESIGPEITAFTVFEADAKSDVSIAVDEIALEGPKGTVRLYTSAKFGPPYVLQVALSGLYPPQNSEAFPTQGVLHLEVDTGPPI
jgi:hypothetical protein